MLIRRWVPEEEGPLLLDLWGQVFGDAWPVEGTWLLGMVQDRADRQGSSQWLAEYDGKPAGFALTSMNEDDAGCGSLLALGVIPAFRRRGIGRRLHDAALTDVRSHGAAWVQLGAGSTDYIWPGVPASLPGAWEFFKTMGWVDKDSSIDLARNLQDYTTPPWVWERLQAAGVEIRIARGEDRLPVLEMVAREETGWTRYYANAFESGRCADVLTACGPGGDVWGCVLLECPTQRWERRFSGKVGAPGCLLTAEAVQGRGIGMGLVAKATELCRERGCGVGYIGWTWLVDWYGKLGYGVWETYHMTWQNEEGKNA